MPPSKGLSSNVAGTGQNFDINKILNDLVIKLKKFFVELPVNLPKFPDYIQAAPPDEIGAFAVIALGLVLMALGVALMLTKGLFTLMVIPFFFIMMIIYAWIGGLAFAESEVATSQNDKNWKSTWMAVPALPLIGVLVYFFVARKELKPMDRSHKPAQPAGPQMMRKAPTRDHSLKM